MVDLGAWQRRGAGDAVVRIPPDPGPGPAHDDDMTTTTGYRITALPAPLLAEARAATTAERHVARGGEPLRCCLRDAREGEHLILFNYEPPLPDSPYREIGAVFAHAEPCAGRADGPRYPEDWYGRAQVLRAYDRDGRIHPASRLHDGGDPEAAIAAVLAEPGVVLLHSRNVVYGCYMFAADSRVAVTSSTSNVVTPPPAVSLP